MNQPQEADLTAQLRAEGYGHVFVWEDRPGALYPPHTHAGQTAHIVLAGEITILSDDTRTTYRAGERFDVPAGQVHAAQIGPEGCRYVVGE